MLTFAASDPSGGAGLQADILTLASMGCHPLSVVTAITVQDTLGVEGVQAIDADWVADQARCLLEDMPVDAFKIGVLGSVENIAAIAEIVSDYPDVPLILDPVLASGRGDELATEEMTHAMRELLLPQTTILTPNSLEARRLADVDDDDEPSLARVRRAADRDGLRVRAHHRHARDHAAGRQHALRARAASCAPTRWPRLPGSYHGSGCTLASAIAAMLANGLDLPEAVREAQDYTWQTLKKAYRPGMGQFLPDRLFWAREDAERARRRRRSAARRRCPQHATDDAAAAAARARAAPRGLYAVTPDLADTGRPRRRASTPRSPAARRRSSTATRRPIAALRRAQAAALARVHGGARRALHRQRRRRARARRRRRRRAPGRGRRRHRARARDIVGPRPHRRRVLLQRPRARAKPRSPPAPTTSRSAASSRRA